VFEPVNDRKLRARLLARKRVDTFDEETLVFRAWATELSPGDGIHIVSATPAARLLRIDDRSKLDAALSRFEAQHHWRAAFLDANPPHWWSEQELESERVAHPQVLSNVKFDGRFKLYALSVSNSDTHITVKLWWEPLQRKIGGDWSFFVHALDSDGRIVLNKGIDVMYWNPVNPGRSIRFDTLSFRKPPFQSVAKLGIGFYRASDNLTLEADSGRRDWGNRRVIVSVR
jgi:hypothetical protein